MNDGLIGLFGRAGAGGVKSVQQGSISIPAASSSNTAAISPVNTAKAILIPLGFTFVSSVLTEAGVRLALTDATTVTATIGAASTNGHTVNFMVLEYY